MEKSPLIAIVGRPNVGKSTLFNRLVGSRRAIVGDEPGITRDRLYGNAHWLGHDFRVVDTGGILPEDKDFIPSEIFRQARVALDEASAVIMVVDARTELAAPDLELARLLQKTGKPLYLAVNKVDSDRQEGLSEDFRNLGIQNLFPVSAEHGRALDDLLDAVIAALPAQVITNDAPEAFEQRKPRSSRSTRRLEQAAADEQRASSEQLERTEGTDGSSDEFAQLAHATVIGDCRRYRQRQLP